jgi:MSHA biogenesis protein MshJ
MWAKLEGQYRQLNNRERTLVLLAGLALIFSGGWFSVAEPMMIKNQKTQDQIVGAERETKELQNQITLLQRSMRGDPNTALRDEMELAKSMSEEVKNDLLVKHNLVVESKTMGLLLGEIVSKARSVKIKSLENRDPISLKIGKDQGAVILYKHEVSLKVGGTFRNILSFLKSLKNTPYTIYWQRFHYNANGYPDSELEVEFYTVSLQKDVISV